MTRLKRVFKLPRGSPEIRILGGGRDMVGEMGVHGDGEFVLAPELHDHINTRAKPCP